MSVASHFQPEIKPIPDKLTPWLGLFQDGSPRRVCDGDKINNRQPDNDSFHILPLNKIDWE